MSTLFRPCSPGTLFLNASTEFFILVLELMRSSEGVD